AACPGTAGAQLRRPAPEPDPAAAGRLLHLPQRADPRRVGPVTGRAARRRERRTRPPLPQRQGLDAVRWVVPPSTPARPAAQALREPFPALADRQATPLLERFTRGQIVAADGAAWSADDLVGPGDQLSFHRGLRAEAGPEGALSILHRVARLPRHDHPPVLDKPHGMATMPRAAHVLSRALVRLRRAAVIPPLRPLHGLDRRPAGVLVFGGRAEERSAYQQLFARSEVDKEY